MLVVFAQASVVRAVTYGAQEEEVAKHGERVAALLGGDPALVTETVEDIRRAATQFWGVRARMMSPLLEARRFEDADAMATSFINDDPTSFTVGQSQRVRVLALMGQKKWPEALTAARAYYDCCLLKDTSDAISLVTACLIGAYPDDPEPARRFKRQQALWSVATPTVPGGATTRPATDDAGPSVLLAIPIDDKRYAGPIDRLAPDGFRSIVFRGNLLLVSGKAREARAAFEQAETVAVSDRQTVEAVEGQARAVRAEAGCVGPANAFIEKLRKNK